MTINTDSYYDPPESPAMPSGDTTIEVERQRPLTEDPLMDDGTDYYEVRVQISDGSVWRAWLADGSAIELDERECRRVEDDLAYDCCQYDGPDRDGDR